MPWALKSPCTYSGCPNVATRRGRCDEHQPVDSTQPWRGRQRARGMSGWEWQRTRQRILERDRFTCQYCGAHGATIVDHIIAWSISRDDSDSNLKACCANCNEIKRRMESIEGRRRSKGQDYRIITKPLLPRRQPEPPAEPPAEPTITF